jgi:hypothetical protein
VLVRSRSGIRQSGAEAEVEVWAESEVPEPPEPRQQQQQQSQISHLQLQRQIEIQRESSLSSHRGRAHSHRLYDVLAAPGRRPPQVTLRPRPSVAPDRGREEVTSLRSLTGPQQQQQLVEPRP